MKKRRQVFLTSTIDTVRSAQKLRSADEKSGAMVVTKHDPAAWKSTKKHRNIMIDRA